MKDFRTSLADTEEIGYVEEFLESVVYVSGLPGAQPTEVVLFETGELGYVFSLSKDRVEVLLLSPEKIVVGTRVTRTAQFLEAPVGFELLGSSIDPLGNPLDPLKPMKPITNFYPLEVIPGGIDVRRRIEKSFESGVALVDMVLPLGQGQRELVIGDRKTGKTNFILQTLVNQAKKGTICIYAAVGKKKLDVKKVEEYLGKAGILGQSIIVASSSQDTSGIIYLTPYTAMSIGEYFRDQGKNALVILDDLTTHAKFYREISLIGRRFPGRNSYPGDIFYTHARLLERAGNFKTKSGENSITCIPVAETVQGDLTGFIQTNLMSMTDGHIYFDIDLFGKGRRPAINPFLSVTRVGRQTQTDTRRGINRELTSFLTLYEKLQRFIHFGAELSETVKNTLNTGEKILMFFDQTSQDIMPMHLQIFLFCLLWIGTWQAKSGEIMVDDMKRFMKHYSQNEQTRRAIDDLIGNSKSFNGLLNDIRRVGVSLIIRAGITPDPAIATMPTGNQAVNTQNVK